jgi:hypothetical protein
VGFELGRKLPVHVLPRKENREGDAMKEPLYDYTSMGFYTFDCLGWPFTAVPPGGGCYPLEELTLAVLGSRRHGGHRRREDGSRDACGRRRRRRPHG